MPLAPAAAARLYGLPLEEFVAERDKAARAAREAGDRDEAAAIAALRKPTVAAWAVNRLARESRHELDLLLDSGKRLVDAQRRSLERGGRDELDRARASYEQAVARLEEDARRILGDRASEATLGRVASTLRAAAIDPDARAELATGTLAREVEGTGWDVLAELGASLPQAGRAERKGERSARASAAERRRRAAEALRAARKLRDEAARRLREAERDEERAGKALAEARARRERAQAELAEAERALEEAKEDGRG